MVEQKVLISVVIPAYNYADTLIRAVESVVTQLTDEHELLIINDGSTDNTQDVIEVLQKKYPSKIRAISQSNAGLAAVRNRGIKESLGHYLIFLDADDEMVSGALELISEKIKKDSSAKMFIGGHISVRSNGKRSIYIQKSLPSTYFERVKAYLIEKTIRLSNGACVMHKDVFSLGEYPEKFRTSEDLPVFAQVLGSFKCSIIAEPLAIIYKHDDSLRHNVSYVKDGDNLVAEIFDTGRLPVSIGVLRKEFSVQRYLSLFRSFLSAGHHSEALCYYKNAIKVDPKAILKFSYTRKALKVWFKK